MSNTTANSDFDGKDGIGTKRQEFRNYLEKTGTLDALTRGLVALYENQGKPPEDPIAFLLENLSIGVSMKAELEAFKKDLEILHGKLADAEAENENLRDALAQKNKCSTDSGGSGGSQERIVEHLIPASAPESVADSSRSPGGRPSSPIKSAESKV